MHVCGVDFGVSVDLVDVCPPDPIVVIADCGVELNWTGFPRWDEVWARLTYGVEGITRQEGM